MKNRNERVRSMVLISLFSTLMCIGAWLHFPSVIPATMQTFVAMCALGILGSKRTFIMLLIYIMLGFVGLPVFSGFTSGIGALTGPTAGFIWGFLMGIPFFAVSRRLIRSEALSLYIGYILYIIIHYIPGALWYCLYSTDGISFSGILSSLTVTVLPFILPDAIKTILAVFTVKKFRKILGSRVFS